jgi:preprotein translocase subunit YajC
MLFPSIAAGGVVPFHHRSPFVITPAFAQSLGAGGGSDMLIQLVPFLLIFVIMWFLIIRPQQRRAKTHQEMIKNVRRGDTIVTSGGLIAKVSKVIDDAELEAEIADGVRVRIVRGMIQDVRSKSEPVKN